MKTRFQQIANNLGWAALAGFALAAGPADSKTTPPPKHKEHVSAPAPVKPRKPAVTPSAAAKHRAPVVAVRDHHAAATTPAKPHKHVQTASTASTRKPAVVKDRHDRMTPEKLKHNQTVKPPKSTTASTPSPKPVQRTPVAVEKPAQPIEPKLGMMMYMDTGEPVGGDLGTNNEDKRFNPASMTKIMTLLIVCREIEAGRLNPDDVINIPHPVFHGTKDYVQRTDALLNYMPFTNGTTQLAITSATVKMTIRSILGASSNNGPVALADRISVSEQAFVERMNSTAQEMGLKNTHFMNASGYPDPSVAKDHYSTPRELLLTAKELAASMNRLKEKYPDLFDGINGDMIKLTGYNKNGSFTYKVKAHSALTGDGALHVDGLEFFKTGHSQFSPESRFGGIGIEKITVNGIEREIGYMAGGFPRAIDRDTWMHNRFNQAPTIIAMDDKMGRNLRTQFANNNGSGDTMIPNPTYMSTTTIPNPLKHKDETAIIGTILLIAYMMQRQKREKGTSNRRSTPILSERDRRMMDFSQPYIT